MITDDRRRFLSVSVRPGGLIDMLLLAGLCATWMGCLARWHWFFALFDHFRLQASVCCLLALMLSAVRRRRGFVGFAAVSLMVNLWPLAQTTWPLPHGIEADERPGLKIVSFNVLSSNTNYDGVLAYLRSADADVICLLEISPAWERALEPLRLTHPHGVCEARGDNFGIAMFSRLPLVDVQVRAFDDETVPSISALIQTGDRRVRLVATHPMPPMGFANHAAWLRQLRGIADVIASDKDTPAIVVGDFNATPWSQGVAGLREHSTLDFHTPKPVWRPTWQARSVLALPIDQALCTPPLFFPAREIGPDLGSDHRAQELLVKWAK